MRAIIVSLALLGAACTSPETTSAPPTTEAPVAAAPDSPEAATAQDTCGASRFQHLIGTDASAIDQSTLPPRTRIITPDSMVTQDFSAERLNIFTSTDGKISSLRCF
ncbi:MAG: I78 family peptidase inhibitor [Hyphomonadaceae bacterium]|nr:I78 family peptidase inhibitor [Hyphomonadaceae bacterium]